VQSVKIVAIIFVNTIYRKEIVFIEEQCKKREKTLKNKGKIP
jgi:O-succinylbenzoate synthase